MPFQNEKEKKVLKTKHGMEYIYVYLPSWP